MGTEKIDNNNDLLASMEYSEDKVISLKWNEHIRLRPGMYIGKLGDGSSPDDGIYILIKEIIDNSIDEFMMGYGKTVEINITDNSVAVRDYGRGIPLNKLKDCVSQINTGAKYDSSVFKKSVGLNGVGAKAVNALSSYFKAVAYRNGESKTVEFKEGEVINDNNIELTQEKNGTYIYFTPDQKLFGKYHFIEEYIDDLLWNYCYLNTGLTINYNGQKYTSKNGLLD
ncbi:MAG: ATP-binding protein, partial [Bacteroidales bacterium]|nr:ATP-binding protein [Bacteroidales bacterium]